jgi:hypothetical protein
VAIPVARFAPQDAVVTSAPGNVDGGRNLIAAGTVLIEIESAPFTACVMVRPLGHESFYCFVDQDRDGRFEGSYHLFSNSYFLLSGWTNRTPLPMSPIPYAAAQSGDLHEHVDLNLELVGKGKDHATYSLTFASQGRKDFWVGAGTLSIGRDKVGKEVHLYGSTISVSSFTDDGPSFSITPPPEGFVAHFVVPKYLDRASSTKGIQSDWIASGQAADKPS